LGYVEKWVGGSEVEAEQNYSLPIIFTDIISWGELYLRGIDKG